MVEPLGGKAVIDPAAVARAELGRDAGAEFEVDFLDEADEALGVVVEAEGSAGDFVCGVAEDGPMGQADPPLEKL